VGGTAVGGGVFRVIDARGGVPRES